MPAPDYLFAMDTLGHGLGAAPDSLPLVKLPQAPDRECSGVGGVLKAISLTQPWATLVMLGEKKYETRCWATKFRGPVWMHAAKGFPGWAKELCEFEPFASVLGSPLPLANPIPCKGALSFWRVPLEVLRAAGSQIGAGGSGERLSS